MLRCSSDAPSLSLAAPPASDPVERGIIGKNESVALLVTGNGLKDTATALSVVSGPIDVEASVDQVEAHL